MKTKAPPSSLVEPSSDLLANNTHISIQFERDVLTVAGRATLFAQEHQAVRGAQSVERMGTLADEMKVRLPESGPASPQGQPKSRA